MASEVDLDASTPFAQVVIQQVQQTLSSVYESVRILFTDLIPSNFSCVIPNAFTWAYRTLWTGSISSFTFQNTVAKTANLFVHGDVVPKPDGRVRAVLLLHGDHSHPLTMLHLADIAQTEGRAVFSVHLPYDDEHPENHRSLLRQSIDKIKEIAAAKGATNVELLLAGHSRGALEAANEAYVANNSQVSGVIAIAGRFKVITPSVRPCRESLIPSVNAVWEKLRNVSERLRVPFYQIAAEKDWIMDPEASIVRRDYNHRSVNAGHLGVISHPDTLAQFKTWVAT